jgi:nucleotide-binding universal stress UspA family protein
MKTILIATDFCPASRNASLYGIELAKALKAKIILFNAFNADASTSSEPKKRKLRYDALMQSDKRLLDEADFLDPEHEIMEVICDEGVAYRSIMDVANEKKVDCIVVGRKGNGRTIKDLFGSTATALTKNSNITLIVVPENAKFEKSETGKNKRTIVRYFQPRALLAK